MAKRRTKVARVKKRPSAHAPSKGRQPSKSATSGGVAADRINRSTKSSPEILVAESSRLRCGDARRAAQQSRPGNPIPSPANRLHCPQEPAAINVGTQSHSRGPSDMRVNAPARV